MIALLLLAVLFDQKLEVPASRWKTIDVPVAAVDMILEASYSVPSNASRVALILLTREDALRFESGRSIRPLESTGWSYDGRLRHRFQNAGSYALVLDNRIEGRQATMVALKVEVTGAEDTTVRELSPQRRTVVITVSLLLFVAIVMFTARKFMH